MGYREGASRWATLPRAYLLWSAMAIATAAAANTDTDSIAATHSLKTVEVQGTFARSPLKRQDNQTVLSAEGIATMPQLLGNADPLRAMQIMPEARTANDIGGGLYVQGAENAHNRITIDGAQIINPMHLLGIFSTLNTPHFRDFSFATSAPSALSANALGAFVDARTATDPDTTWRADITAGLIDSHATVTAPIPAANASLTLSGRLSYIDLIFGNAIRFDHAKIKYNFQDWNATYTQRLSNDWRLSANAYYGHDKMRLCDEMYNSDGYFRWHNLTAGINLYAPKIEHRIGVSHYAASFDLTQGGTALQMPSALTQATYSGDWRVGDIEVGADLAARWVTEQYNAIRYDKPKTDFASETSLAANWRLPLPDRWHAQLGFRLSLFARKGFARLYPLPRLTVGYDFAPWAQLRLQYGMHMQATHCIIESDAGMPTDFYINASRRFRPQRAHMANIRLQGRLPGAVQYSIEGYYRRIFNATEYAGAILNMISPGYNPLDEVATGRVTAYGMGLTINRTFGHVTGWLGYNLGFSNCHFPTISSEKFPSAHDRLHDFSATATWRISPAWRLSATGVYATGFPYTKAAYGYMIGENLICEYFPHNSSRLPAYKRVDVGLTWAFDRQGAARQELNLSVFNLFAWDNVIFQYDAWSAEHGLTHRQASSRFIIPSISYTLKFR